MSHPLALRGASQWGVSSAGSGMVFSHSAAPLLPTAVSLVLWNPFRPCPGQIGHGENPFRCAQGGKQSNGPGSTGKWKNPLQLHMWNVPDPDKMFHLQENDCPKIPQTQKAGMGVSPRGCHQAGPTGSTGCSANTKPHGRVWRSLDNPWILLPSERPGLKNCL